MTDRKPKLTVPDLAKKKAAGERLSMVAIADYMTASWAYRAGIDIVGVGDSMGMTMYGHENTLECTVEQMIDHTKAVRRGAPDTFCITAMPYGSYATEEIAVVNALRMMKESGTDALKLQGGRDKFSIIKAVADAGVPIMGHVGLIPHQVHRMGGFKTQGRTASAALEIIDNARAIEQAGGIGMEIEAVPREVGKAVDDAVSIFTFSIGAGSSATGQLLNAYDLIGSFDTFKPKFAKRYGNVNEVATKALAAYVADVAAGAFPDDEHSYGMDPDEAAALAAALEEES
ncbi:MAG: 3-methyl-2-oxobutanoate hydroxymethyltransferase [Acidimicrobiales bacterium]|nr:3-methyl-2-oxobutanoate hydroxymethyltransferase [Acidimicrobiales bacterium]